jgi:hypothetical protein
LEDSGAAVESGTIEIAIRHKEPPSLLRQQTLFSNLLEDSGAAVESGTIEIAITIIIMRTGACPNCW